MRDAERLRSLVEFLEFVDVQFLCAHSSLNVDLAATSLRIAIVDRYVKLPCEYERGCRL